MGALQTVALIAGTIIGLSGAITVVWCKVVRPVARFDRALPTLLGIADQFSPNSGSSLHDRIVALTATTDATHGEVLVIRDRIAQTESRVVRLEDDQPGVWAALGRLGQDRRKTD